jgi:hypothetical protein
VTNVTPSLKTQGFHADFNFTVLRPPRITGAGFLLLLNMESKR